MKDAITQNRLQGVIRPVYELICPHCDNTETFHDSINELRTFVHIGSSSGPCDLETTLWRCNQCEKEFYTKQGRLQ